MKQVQIFTTEYNHDDLRRRLFPPGDSNEHFGLGLAGVSHYPGGCNLLLRKFIAADSSCLIKQAGASVMPDPIFVDYVRALAKKSNSITIDVHTHPFSDKGVTFSGIDDRSEYESFPETVQLLGEGPHASVVLGRNSLDARWYDAKTGKLRPIAAVKVLGKSLKNIVPTSFQQLHCRRSKDIRQLEEIHDRQIRVFGKEGQEALQQLTVAVVGVGGIGSALFLLLVYLGVGRIVIVDIDVVEVSNLNRLWGATLEDAKKKRSKVHVLARRAFAINPNVEVIPIQASIVDEKVQERLKVCDAIFGCTDNEASRWVLNTFCIEHLKPYFDTGTGIRADSNQRIKDAGGQVRVVIPGMGCLNCISGIDITTAQQELMPEPDRQVAIQRGYIAGADVVAPAVASLNGVIANLAVTEFMAFATGFKHLYRYVDYYFLQAASVGFNFAKDPNCYICSPAGSLGIGDNGLSIPMEMLLDEPQLQEQSKGGKADMEAKTGNIRKAIEDLLQMGQQQGLNIEGDPDGQWFLIGNVKAGKPLNKTRTTAMVKFLGDSRDPIILVPENLEIGGDSSVCPGFLAKHTFVKGWKPLCPHMFQDVVDQLLEFVVCITGFIANPTLCGLMGCEGRNREKNDGLSSV